MLLFLRYTASKKDKSTIYSLLLDWPVDNEVTLGALKDIPVSNVTLLGSEAVMKFSQESAGLRVVFPYLNIRQMPCLWAWSLKISLQ